MQISILTRLGNEIASKYMNSSASAKHIILTLRFCVSVVLFVYNLLFFSLAAIVSGSVFCHRLWAFIECCVWFVGYSIWLLSFIWCDNTKCLTRANQYIEWFIPTSAMKPTQNNATRLVRRYTERNDNVQYTIV